MKKKYGLCLLVSIVCFDLSCLSQKKIYKYEVEKRIYTLDSVLYDCLESEFGFIRYSFTNDQIIDYSFYTNGRDTTYRNTDSFRIINAIWSIKKRAGWKYFFSEKQFAVGKETPFCYLLDSSFSLSPYKKMLGKNGELLFAFRLKSKSLIDNLTYIFDPRVGFISMQIGRCKLKLVEN